MYYLGLIILQKRISGQCILDALEFRMPNLPFLSGNFPQVSGISFDVDTSFGSKVVVDKFGMFVNITGKRRVSNVKINGIDLESENYIMLV